MRCRVLKVLSLLLLGAAWAVAAQAAVYNPADYNFTNLDYPGAPVGISFAGTGLSGLNNLGQITGGYGTWSPKKSHGLLYGKQGFTGFDYPESGYNSSTAGAGINDAGIIVGGYNLDVDYTDGNRGFKRSGINYTTLSVPWAQYNTAATDINNFGTIIGTYDFSFVPLVTHSFIYDGTNYQDFYNSAYANTLASGINDAGLIVGSVTDSSGSNAQGFLLNGSTYTILICPFGNQTNAMKINKAGDIAGFYTVGTGSTAARHGFVYSKGNYYAFDVPFFGAKWTMLTGINNAGQIAGTWVDSSYAGHGFVATPKRPKSTLVPLELLME